MQSSIQRFNQEGYSYLANFLDKTNCQELVEEFKKCIDQRKTFQDEQCPLSHSLGHSEVFDSLLEQLTPNIEAATGKKLYPTYVYARWYAPGDELEIHLDRPACEISATITLGFEGNPWPIFIGYDENKKNCRQINMNVGDAVIYKGEELYHWREKYTEGNWQAQVFLHYVDQDGPNAEWKYDKRECLSHHKKQLKEDSMNQTHRILKQAFSKESLKNILENLESNTGMLKDAELVGGIVDKNVRNSKKTPIDPNRGLASSLTGIGLNCNKLVWNFDITNSNQSEFLRYDKNGHFQSHIDTEIDRLSYEETRKLTIIILLNNDFEGGRFYLQTSNERQYIDLQPGDVIVFPSFLLHGVEPITSGIRRSVVTWLVGPYFK